jgi:hypothetical protein
MTLLKVAAIVGSGLILATAPALAGLASPAGPRLVEPHSQVEQNRSRRNMLTEALIGGMIPACWAGWSATIAISTTAGMTTVLIMAARLLTRSVFSAATS